MSGPIQQSVLLTKTDELEATSALPAVDHSLNTDTKTLLIRACGELSFEVAKLFFDKDESFVISAFSLLPVFGMLLRGMSDPSEKHKMIEKLGLTGISETQIHQSICNLLKSSECNDEKSHLIMKSSNTLMTRGSICNRNYVQDLKDYYNAMVFEGKIDAKVINERVKENTNGLFKKTITQEKADLYEALIINTFYFKGAWRYKFKKENTQLRNFTDIEGKTEQVQMMYQKTQGEVFQGRGMLVFKKEYKSPDGRNLFHAFIKPVGQDIKSLEKSLSFNELEHALRNSKRKQVEFWLPRLDISSGVKNLQDKLLRYPLNACYDDMAPGLPDFELEHGGRLRLDEEGGEAAGRGVGGARESGAISTPIKIKLEESFMQVIGEETRSGNVNVYFTSSIKNTKGMDK